MRVRLVEPAAAGIAQREPRAGRTLVRLAAASGDPHREPLSGAAGPKNNQTLALEPGVCGLGCGRGPDRRGLDRRCPVGAARSPKDVRCEPFGEQSQRFSGAGQPHQVGARRHPGRGGQAVTEPGGLPPGG